MKFIAASLLLLLPALFVARASDDVVRRALKSVKAPKSTKAPGKSTKSCAESGSCDTFGVCEAEDSQATDLCNIYAACKPSNRVCPSDSMDATCKAALPDICPTDLKTPCTLAGYQGFCKDLPTETCREDCELVVRNCCPRTPFDSIKERFGYFVGSSNVCTDEEDGIIAQAQKACDDYANLDFCERDLCWTLEERACRLCGARCSYGGKIYRLVNGTLDCGGNCTLFFGYTDRRLSSHPDGSVALFGGLDSTKTDVISRHLRIPLTKEEIEDIMTKYKHPQIDQSGTHYVKPNVLTPKDCGLLMDFLEENRYRSDKHEKRSQLESAKLYISPNDLINTIGKESTQNVLNAAYEAAGEVRPVLKMWIAQVSNDGQHQEDYHTDWRSERQESTTFMVSLNKNEDLISGGDVIYLSRDGPETVMRDQGMAYAQSSRVFHGVPAFEGVRRTLFIILVKDMGLNPSHHNLLEGTGLM